MVLSPTCRQRGDCGNTVLISRVCVGVRVCVSINLICQNCSCASTIPSPTPFITTSHFSVVIFTLKTHQPVRGIWLVMSITHEVLYHTTALCMEKSENSNSHMSNWQDVYCIWILWTGASPDYEWGGSEKFYIWRYVHDCLFAVLQGSQFRRIFLKIFPYSSVRTVNLHFSFKCTFFFAVYWHY